MLPRVGLELDVNPPLGRLHEFIYTLTLHHTGPQTGLPQSITLAESKYLNSIVQFFLLFSIIHAHDNIKSLHKILSWDLEC